MIRALGFDESEDFLADRLFPLVFVVGGLVFLAIDIGNTNITFGLFGGEVGNNVSPSTGLLGEWRFSSDSTRTLDEYFVMLDSVLRMKYPSFRVSQVGIASVVPQLEQVFVSLVSSYFALDPFVLKVQNTSLLDVMVRPITSLGADRFANAIACKVLFGFPSIVVDFGTATTLDVLGVGGAYDGGLIAPGLEASLSNLVSRTALLKTVEVRKSDNLIGLDTESALRNGCYWGYVCMVEGLLSKLEEELGRECIVVMTGGLAGLLSQGIRRKKIKIAPELTLYGIKLASEAEGLNVYKAKD